MLAVLSVLHVFLLLLTLILFWHLFWVLQQQKVIPEEGKTVIAFGWEAESVMF